MTDENKTETVVVQERVRGDRGEIGEASAALSMKKLWTESGKKLSLKMFARHLLIAKDPLAKEWFARKRGSLNKNRSDANVKAARETASASKAARRKTTQGKAKATETK